MLRVRITCQYGVYSLSHPPTSSPTEGLVTTYREGGGATKREGGAHEVIPLQKGGAEKVLAMLKGGLNKFWGFYAVP